MSVTSASPDPDALERFSRRSLGVALVVLLLAGGVAGGTLVHEGPWGGAAAWGGRLLPPAIAVVVAALRPGPGLRAALAGLQRDEWRRQGLALATRDALVATMVAQPVLAVALSGAAVPAPLALMACAGVTLAAAVFLASLLWRDR